MRPVDTKIDVDDFYPKVVPQGFRRPNSLPLMLYHGSENRSNFLSYYIKLPEEPLKLSVLKLDGSSFDIEVMRSATVAELKEAVEAMFSHMPRKGPGKISWSHVWGHFCLCYDGQKLVEDSDHIRNYGIRDGDQEYDARTWFNSIYKLEFIRHVSTNYYSPSKRQLLKWTTAPEKQRISLSESSRYWEKEHRDEKDDSYDDIENGRHQHLEEIDYTRDEDDDAMVGQPFKRWLPYSGLPTVERTRSLADYHSRSTCSFFDNFKRMMLSCGANRYSPGDVWRED